MEGRGATSFRTLEVITLLFRAFILIHSPRGTIPVPRTYTKPLREQTHGTHKLISGNNSEFRRWTQASDEMGYLSRTGAGS